MTIEAKLNLEELEDFQHTYNPQHLYCRLKELGLERERARGLVRIYEGIFYRPLSQLLHKTYFNDSSIQEEVE